MEKTTFPETRAVLDEALSAPLDRRRLFDALNALALLDEAHSETTLTELALAWRRTGGRPKTDPGLTLRDLFDRFIARYRAEQTATRGRMRWMARTMCRALGPGMPVAALRREDVVGVLETMRSPRSHNGLLSDVAAALRWGNREGLCDLPFVETLLRSTCGYSAANAAAAAKAATATHAIFFMIRFFPVYGSTITAPGLRRVSCR